MNRQARRRAEREGTKGPQWDIIIPSILVVLVVLIFIGNYLFPNINLSNYSGAPPRILRKIGDRGIASLTKDWPEITTFSYGYFEDDEWPTYMIEKKEESWAFEDLENETTIEYATNNLPEYYADLPELLTKMQAALHSKEYTVAYQQTIETMNIFTVVKLDKDTQKQEQFVLGFDENHKLDRIMYYNTLDAEQPVGYAYADLYTEPELVIITE